MTSPSFSRRGAIALASRSTAVALAACLFPRAVWATPNEAKTLLATLGSATPQPGPTPDTKAAI